MMTRSPGRTAVHRVHGDHAGLLRQPVPGATLGRTTAGAAALLTLMGVSATGNLANKIVSTKVNTQDVPVGGQAPGAAEEDVSTLYGDG